MRNSLVISILSIHWLPKMMAQKKSLGILARKSDKLNAPVMLLAQAESFLWFPFRFCHRLFSPLLTTHDEFHFDGGRRFGMRRAGVGRDALSASLVLGKSFAQNRNKILSISSPLFPIEKTSERQNSFAWSSGFAKNSRNFHENAMIKFCQGVCMPLINSEWNLLRLFKFQVSSLY